MSVTCFEMRPEWPQADFLGLQLGSKRAQAEQVLQGLLSGKHPMPAVGALKKRNGMPAGIVGLSGNSKFRCLVESRHPVRLPRRTSFRIAKPCRRRTSAARLRNIRWRGEEAAIATPSVGRRENRKWRNYEGSRRVDVRKGRPGQLSLGARRVDIAPKLISRRWGKHKGLE